MTNKQIINSLSKHLFWDSDTTHFDQEKNKRWLVQRVLEYGMLSDWRLICKLYGLEEIKEEAKKLRTLEDRAFHFIAAITDTPLSEFRCYSIKQSNPGRLNF